MKRQAYIEFKPQDEPIFNRIEAARLAKGMTRKGFVLHAIANQYPELTEAIVKYLINSNKPMSDRIREELNNG